MFAIHSSRLLTTSRSTSASRSSSKRPGSSGRRHSPERTRPMPGSPPRSNVSWITASASSPMWSYSRPMFQRITSAPRGRSTRPISATDLSDANQWNASAEKTASTSPSARGISSALPRRASAPGTTSSSTPSIAASGSTARTRANRRTSDRVSLPVPAPRSSTSASGRSPRSETTRSSSSSGQSGRPSSYSLAVRPKASGGASLGDTCQEKGSVLLQHLAGDHEPLDLVRALVDLRDLGVAHHPLDGVLLDVAVAAEDLHRVGRHLHRDVRAEQLCHRGDLRQLRPVRALVDQLPALVEQAARRFALRLHVGQHRRDELVLRDRHAHGLARLRVLERVVRRALREAEALRADPGPRAVEDLHRDPEAFALLAEQVVRRDAAVVEEDLARGRALDSHLRLDPPDLEPGRVRFDHERGDTGMAGLGIGLCEDDVEACDAGVRDEALRAVEDVIVALAPRLAAHRGRIRARARLRQRVGREPLAAREPRQPTLLLLVGARELDPERAQLLDGEEQTRRRADLRELLDRDEHHERARARAAVLLLERQPEDLVLAQQLDHVPGELGRLVDLGRAWSDVLARKRAHEVADLALLVRQRVAGHGSSLVFGRAC